MPITSSAKKALKQSHKKKARNDNFRKLYREARKALEKAIKLKEFTDSDVLLNTLYSAIDKLLKKNIIHRNNAARKKSKFAKLLKNAKLA